jgi:hypothetical protein
MDFAEIGIHAGFWIGNHGVGLPGLPELVDDLDPFVGDLVALVVFMVALETEILRRPVVVCRYEIEANAALGEVIEGRTQTRRQVWRIEARGHGGDNAEMARLIRQERHQRHRIVLWHRIGVVQVPFRRSLVGVRHKGAVFDHHVVEAGTLHCLHEVNIEVGLHVVGADGAGPLLVPGMNGIASANEPAHVKHGQPRSRKPLKSWFRCLRRAWSMPCPSAHAAVPNSQMLSLVATTGRGSAPWALADVRRVSRRRPRRRWPRRVELVALDVGKKGPGAFFPIGA